MIAPQGSSYEDKTFGHGVLTYGILQAIKPESDLNGDGYLSVAELEAATYVNVIRAQKGLRDGLVFRSRSFSSGKDFVLGKIGPAKGLADSAGGQVPASERPVFSGPALSGKYRALLFATDKYRAWEELHNPIYDAEAIEKELKERYGFITKLYRDPPKKVFSDALEDLKTRPFGPDDELLIFIAGHGTFDESENTGYLVMSDSQREQEDKAHDSYYSQVKLNNLVKGIKCKHVFLVIDACHSGAIALNRNDPKKDITYTTQKLQALIRKKEKRTLIFLTSGGNVYVPDGNPGAHSPFAFQFLRALQSSDADPEGIITFLDVMKYADQVPKPAPLPLYGWFPDSEPASDFWLVAKPELRGEPPADQR